MDSKFGKIKLGTNLDAKAFDLRVKLTDIGKLKTPAGGGAPSTKGSICYPKPVGKGSK